LSYASGIQDGGLRYGPYHAKTLNLSVKTVNAYRDHIKEKLRIDGAGPLRKFAVKWVQSRDS
jgi:hypothetical protein